MRYQYQRAIKGHENVVGTLSSKRIKISAFAQNLCFYSFCKGCTHGVTYGALISLEAFSRRTFGLAVQC